MGQMRGYMYGDGRQRGRMCREESESRDSRHGHTATPIASLAQLDRPFHIPTSLIQIVDRRERTTETGRVGIYIMASGGRRQRRRWRAREKDSHTFAGSRRGARRKVVRKKWTERDLDVLCRNDEDEALRYVATGATEKGATVVECLTAQVPRRAVCRSGSHRHGRGSEMEQEKRKVREVVVD